METKVPAWLNKEIRLIAPVSTRNMGIAISQLVHHPFGREKSAGTGERAFDGPLGLRKLQRCMASEKEARRVEFPRTARTVANRSHASSCVRIGNASTDGGNAAKRAALRFQP